jgi:hypothetical protein
MASERHEQPADWDWMVDFAGAVLRSHEPPPRPVSGASAIACASGGRKRVVQVVIASAVFAGLFVLTFFQEGSVIVGLILQAMWLGGFLLVALLIPWTGLRVARWTRDGLVARADVTNVRMVNDQTDATPRASGRRVVHHPTLGAYDEDFTIAGSWVHEIAKGSGLDVLVAPDHAKSWLTLGLHDPSSTLDRGQRRPD